MFFLPDFLNVLLHHPYRLRGTAELNWRSLRTLLRASHFDMDGLEMFVKEIAHSQVGGGAEFTNSATAHWVHGRERILYDVLLYEKLGHLTTVSPNNNNKKGYAKSV